MKHEAILRNSDQQQQWDSMGMVLVGAGTYRQWE